MVVSRKSTPAFFFALSTLLGLSSLTIPPTLAQTPSLGNGIICVARGKTTQGNRIYLYTSVIDYNSIQKKQPVSVIINESMVTVEAEELVVVDSQANTLTIVDSATGSPPEMQPVGRASTIYQGNNTFSGIASGLHSPPHLVLLYFSVYDCLNKFAFPKADLKTDDFPRFYPV